MFIYAVELVGNRAQYSANIQVLDTDYQIIPAEYFQNSFSCPQKSSMANDEAAKAAPV